MSETVGQRIKAAREAKRLSRAKLGKRLELSGITIKQYETDKREPRLETLRNIAAALDCTVSWLVGEPCPSGYRVSVSCDGHARLYTPIESEEAS